MKNILKAGKASKELIEAARLVRCQSCEDTAPRPRDHPVGNSNFQYEFNAMLGLDVTEMKDYAGNKYSILTMLDISTGFHLSEVVKEGGGMPTSEACAQAILRRWISWAGFPKAAIMDRGVHNRGEVSKLFASHGVEIFYAPLETPSAVGKVERHQGILKAILRKTIHDMEAVGRNAFETCLHECTSVKNHIQRVQGYSPAQWVLGRNPRVPGSVTDMDEAGNLGILENKLDPAASYHLCHASRMAAQKAFIHLDTSSHVARALTRNAAVQNKKSFVVGDLVVYRRDTQHGGTVWSTASRVIGVDPHNGIWLLHEGVPVLCAAGKLRSANESESLAYSILNNIPVFPEAVTLGQQKYVRMMEEEASPKKGQKRGVQAEDKTGKAARSSARASGSAVAVPMTPGGIVGDDEVMIAMVDNEDHWRISESHAIRVHNKRRFHDFHPLYDGDVPEGFGGRRVTRKVYEDISRVTSESMPGMDDVDSRAWTGFTVFTRVRHPLIAIGHRRVPSFRRPTIWRKQ